jgi:hypothetical protein
MITARRKGKRKHIVEFGSPRSDQDHSHIRDWCTEMFGPGGSNPRCRWRYGWVSDKTLYHFKHGEDATAFMLRWA